MITVEPKPLTQTLKPICAQIRKTVKAKERRENPLADVIRIQASTNGVTAAPLFDSIPGMGRFPNESAPVDVLLGEYETYALATLIDPKRPVTLTVEIATIESDRAPLMRRDVSTGPCLVVRQPSCVPGKTDTMRFKTIGV